MEPKAKNEEKKSYQAPELSIHGDIEEITRELATGPADGDTGGSQNIDVMAKVP